MLDVKKSVIARIGFGTKRSQVQILSPRFEINPIENTDSGVDGESTAGASRANFLQILHIGVFADLRIRLIPYSGLPCDPFSFI
jgi:hypothetical protein